MFISTGNFGIGTASPAAILDVAGEIKFSSSGLACTTARDGTVRYVSSGASPPWEYCDGSAWVNFKQPRCQDNDTGECYSQVPRRNDDLQFTAANIASGVNILGVTGTLNPLCSGSQSYTTSGTYTLTVDSSNVNCPMTFVVAGGGGGGGNNGGSVGAPGGDGGLNSFTFTPRMLTPISPAASTSSV